MKPCEAFEKALGIPVKDAKFRLFFIPDADRPDVKHRSTNLETP
jgi:hypothetical protein